MNYKKYKKPSIGKDCWYVGYVGDRIVLYEGIITGIQGDCYVIDAEDQQTQEKIKGFLAKKKKVHTFFL